MAPEAASALVGLPGALNAVWLATYDGKRGRILAGLLGYISLGFRAGLQGIKGRLQPPRVFFSAPGPPWWSLVLARMKWIRAGLERCCFGLHACVGDSAG